MGEPGLRRYAVLWLLALIGWTMTARPALAQSATPSEPRIGAVEAFWVPEEAARLGLGWERILFYWSEIQPTGPEDWNTLHVDDRWLARAAADGREVVGLLKQTPAWATEGLPVVGTPRGLYLPSDDPQNLWANYVRRIAAYYAPRGVHHWIIWNEPEIDPTVYGYEFAGSVADYYQLVKVAHQVMKAVDPLAVIHLAGVTYWHDAVAGRPQYLQRFLEEAARDPQAETNGFFFDVISLHIYFRVESIPAIVQEVEQLQARFGLDKPIWLNETNAPPDQDPLWPVERPTFPVNLEQQAWFVPQAIALAFASGVERVGVYKFTDILVAPGAEPFGLLRADLTPRPALTALANTLHWLRGFTAVEVTTSEAAQVVTFYRPGEWVRLVWARGPQPVPLTLPARAAAGRVVDVFGASQALQPTNGVYALTLGPAQCAPDCFIGGPPLFVVESVAAATVAPTFTPAVPPTSQPTPTAAGVLDAPPARPAGRSVIGFLIVLGVVGMVAWAFTRQRRA